MFLYSGERLRKTKGMRRMTIRVADSSEEESDVDMNDSEGSLEDLTAERTAEETSGPVGNDSNQFEFFKKKLKKIVHESKLDPDNNEEDRETVRKLVNLSDAELPKLFRQIRDSAHPPTIFAEGAVVQQIPTPRDQT